MTTPEEITEGIIDALGDDEVKRQHWLGKIVWQDGPIKVYGVNGLQVDDVIGAALAKLEVFYVTLPSGETALAIDYLRRALAVLEMRTKDREARKVEGTENK